MKSLQEISQGLSAKVLGIVKIFNSKIEKDVAARMVTNYRSQHPGGLKSIWLNDEIADAIIALRQNGYNISGVKVYFALEATGEFTVILSLTETDTKDSPNSYFNYGRPCPPPDNCVGDILDPI